MIWSPYICIFTKKSSLKVLNELQYDIYERCSTFDGPEHFTKTSSLQEKKMTEELRQLGNMISTKVMNISYDMFDINRMVLYFKQDKNKNVYFLYASSSRTKEYV